MTESFGPYRLTDRLGAGGMGEVWRALDTRLGRPVALKFLAPDLARDETARHRFVRESRAASALNHPNIVTVYEAGERDGRPYQAVELVEGRTVRELLAEGPLPAERVTEVARQALRGLGAAHGAGIVHRDVKPENLMVRTDGLLKIVDFGLARLPAADASVELTAHDALVGTPRYMAPEQAISGRADGRADLFSLGAVLYEMLAGRPAFPGATLGEVFGRLVECRPAPLEGVQPSLADLVSRLLQKEPERRPRDAEEALRSLDGPGAAAVAPAGSERVPARSLVVLPMASAPEDGALADGLTAELITRVGRIRGLRVLGRSTSLRYREQADACEVGRSLNVHLVLESNLRHSGTRLRVSLSLVDSSDGFQIWSDRVEGTAEDLFDMEDRVAETLVEALEGRIEGLQVAPPSPRAEVTPRARELYLEGARALTTLDVSQTRRAREVLEEAIRLEPGFGQARGRLSLALLQAAYTEPPEGIGALFERARSEAEQAFALAPESAEARIAMALVAFAGEDLSGARSLLRRLVAAQPDHVEALCWLSYVSTTLGNVEEGTLLARRAAALDPEGAAPQQWLCYSLASQGRFLDASEAAARALRLEPQNPYGQNLALLTDVALGRLDDAARFAEHLRSLPERDAFCEIGLLLQAAASEPRTLEGLGLEAVAPLRRDLDCDRMLASVFALLGRREEAVELLGSALARGHRNLAWLDNDPTLAGLRETEAFRALRDEMARAVRGDRELDSAG